MKKVIHFNQSLVLAILLTVVMVMPLLSGCTGSQAKDLKNLSAKADHQQPSPFRKTDWVKVTSANGHQVGQITNRHDVIYVSDIVSDAAKDDQVGLGTHYLSDKHPSYYYTFYQAKPKVAIHLTVYSDAKQAQVTHLPIIHAVHYKLSPTSYHKLTHPVKTLGAQPMPK